MKKTVLRNFRRDSGCRKGEPFSLTLDPSPAGREKPLSATFNPSAASDQLQRSDTANGGERNSLSQRERAGVRENAIIYFVAVILLSLATTVFAADETALQPVTKSKPILQDLQQKMSSLKSVYLDFTQERHLKLFTDPLKSEGVMLIGQPDKIRWETTAPYQSILLANNKSVAQFERNEDGWKKLKLGFPQLLKRVMDQMVLMNQGKLDALTSDFTISVATNSSVAVLTLVPKDENVRGILAALEVRMQPDFSATREVVMHEPGGDFTRIIFTRERRNVTFPENTFDQTKPLDVAAIRAAVNDAP